MSVQLTAVRPPAQDAGVSPGRSSFRDGVAPPNDAHRQDYTNKELDNATTAVTKQLAAYKKLAKEIDAAGGAKASAALEASEPLFL